MALSTNQLIAAANNKTIWVSVSGSNSGSGSQSSPYKTIQYAINKADPGTVIKVKSGNYNENITFESKNNSDLSKLSKANPLVIESVDGTGKAVIRGLSSKNDSTIELNGRSDVVIKGFEIVGNTSGRNDEGPIKIIGQFDDGAGNIHIVNNIISGNGVDGIKATKVDDIVVTNNIFKGAYTQQIIDLVHVADSTVSNNTFRGSADSGITAKAGSENIDITKNLFDFKSTDERGGLGPAIKIGGEGFSSSFDGVKLSYEAKNVLVENNVLKSYGDYGVQFQGGQNSTVRDNFFDNSGDYAFRSMPSYSSYAKSGKIDSRGNDVYDNTIENGLKLLTSKGGDPFNKFSSNSAGSNSETDSDVGSSSSSTTSGGESKSATTTNSSEPKPVTTTPSSDQKSVTTTPKSEPKSASNITETSSGDGGKLTIKAGGTGTDLFPPKFQVIVNGRVISNEAISSPLEGSGSSKYVKFDVKNDALFETFTYELASAPSEVKIAFTNDGTDEGINRDFYLDHIKYDSKVFEAEKDGFYDATNGSSSRDGATEKAFWGGTFEFDIG